MSYNTRRSGGGGGGNANFAGNAAPGSAGIGRRTQNAPPLGNNFVPGGQLAQPNKPTGPQGGPQGNQQQRPGGFQQPPQMQQQQQQLQRQMQMSAQQQKPMQQSAQQMVAAQQQAPKIVFTKPEDQSTPVKQNPPPAPSISPSETSSTNGDAAGGEAKRKPFWMKKEGKISKKERLRRRNQRLRKILQPKNALMVLNEMIGNAQYTVMENADPHSGPVFRCSVMVDNVPYMGYGRSKPAAKTSAAECAIKNMVLGKLKVASLLNPQSETSGSITDISAIEMIKVEGEPMVTNTEEEAEDTIAGISWSHIASYALHKLLSSWGEDNLPEKVAQMASGLAAQPAVQAAPPTPPEKKPAKKMPENAISMNPIMLLNQMHPNAVYEELSKTGPPPKFIFTIKCTVGDKSFTGTGNSKKLARKNCAYAACREVLGVEYPPEVLAAAQEESAPMQVGMVSSDMFVENPVWNYATM